MSKSKIYFKNLDAIRFIAALLVYVDHGFSPSFQYLPVKNTMLEKFLFVIGNGAIGVYVFFVLSGFLITYLLISEYELNTKISLKNFYMRRVLRIWPLYFLVVVFSFLIIPLISSYAGVLISSASNLFYHITFLSNFDVLRLFENKLGLINPLCQNITWSVSVEEQFYLFWPLIFVFLPKRIWFHALLFVIGASLFFRMLYHSDSFVLYFHTIALLIYLGTGALMAYLIKTSEAVKRLFENASTYTHLLLFSISFCMLFGYSTIFSFKYGDVIGSIVISVSFALIIAAQALTKSTSGLNLHNFLFATKWGKYTYGIYLIHPLVLALMDILMQAFHIPLKNFASSFSYGIIGLILTLVLSKMSYHYYESRFLRLKERFNSSAD